MYDKGTEPRGIPAVHSPVMNRTKFLGLALLATVAGGTLLPADAQAQYGRRPGRSVRSADWIVRPLVNRTERESNAFRAWFERSGSRRDGGLKRNVQRLDEALERLRDRASDGRPGVGRPELERALVAARAVDGQIFRGRQGRVTVREWNDLQRTLNDLARLYRIRGV